MSLENQYFLWGLLLLALLMLVVGSRQALRCNLRADVRVLLRVLIWVGSVVLVIITLWAGLYATFMLTTSVQIM